ncbi:MAG: 30S ribosomal protein S3 [Ruminococcaceae bacterium]|nr:30S ribosomal protein S3 [Oscillospiraceae bacterium]
MGQKVNPHGLRVGVIKNWDSRWFASDETFGDILVSDYNIRKFLKTKLQEAGVPKIEIERDKNRVKVYIFSSKPGMILGRNSDKNAQEGEAKKPEAIETLRKEVEAIAGKPVSISVIEIRNPDANAQLVAENIALALEKRTSFRRAMKNAIGRSMRAGAKGIKVTVSGRLGGAEIARSEHYHEGTIPLQTIRADIEYGFWEANTTYGKIGVKVWIFKGEVLPNVKKNFTTIKPREVAPKNDRRGHGDRRNDRRNNGERRNFGDRKQGNRPFQGERKPFNKEGGNK